MSGAVLNAQGRLSGAADSLPGAEASAAVNLTRAAGVKVGNIHVNAMICVSASTRAAYWRRNPSPVPSEPDRSSYRQGPPPSHPTGSTSGGRENSIAHHRGEIGREQRNHVSTMRGPGAKTLETTLQCVMAQKPGHNGSQIQQGQVGRNALTKLPNRRIAIV